MTVRERFNAVNTVKTIKRILKRLSIRPKSVNINKIRAIDLKCYTDEGYGGRHISFFPPYTFFKVYLHESESKGILMFVDWYRKMFNRYYNVPKTLGGMRHGSLYKLVEKNHLKKNIILNSDLSNLSDVVYEQSLQERVAQRFELLESIRCKGFIKTGDAISGISKNGFVYLKSGHHRCATLHLLGYREVSVELYWR